MIYTKNPAQIQKMRDAGKLLHQVLEHLKTMIKPGMTTLEIDREAERMIRAACWKQPSERRTTAFISVQWWNRSAAAWERQRLLHLYAVIRRIAHMSATAEFIFCGMAAFCR